MPERTDRREVDRRAFADLCERIAPQHPTKDRHALYKLSRLLRQSTTCVSRSVDADPREEE